MLPEIPGGGFGYDKIALMRLPVCVAGFGGFLRFHPVAGGLGLGVDQHLPLQLLFPLQLGFQRFQFAASLPHFRIGGVYGRFQLLRGSKSVFLIHIQCLCRLFQIVYLCPMLVAFSLALGSLGGYVHKPLHTVLFGGGYLGSGGLQTVFYGARDGGRFGCSGGVLFQKRKNGGAVKIVAQLPGGNGLCPVRREVGKPPPALLDGHALPQQQRGKLVKAGSGEKGFAYGPPQLFLVRFKLGLPGCDTLRKHGGVLFVQHGLSLFLRPILSFCDAVLAAVQEVNLVNPLPVAHLHDFGFEVAQGSIGTEVLAPGFRVGWPVHVG